MRQGRLSVEFRDRTKAFASRVIRLFVQLPRQREEVRVLGNNFFVRGHPSRRTPGKPRARDRTTSSWRNSAEHFRKLMIRNFGWSCCAMTAESLTAPLMRSSERLVS